jgi:hypothetical protein
MQTASNTQAQYHSMAKLSPSSSSADPGTYTGVTVEGYCLGPAGGGESLGSVLDGSYCFDSPAPSKSYSAPRFTDKKFEVMAGEQI